MEKFSIKSNIVRLEVEKANGETYVLSFNPDDLVFVNNMYSVYRRIDNKKDRYELELKALLQDKTKDKYGLPANIQKILDVNLKYVEYYKSEIDLLFGEGTYKEIFGDTADVQSIISLFEGVMPYISAKRKTVVKKYIDDSENSDGILS